MILYDLINHKNQSIFRKLKSQPRLYRKYYNYYRTIYY